MDTQEHVHVFAETVVPATCQSSGYTLHRCDCGYEYKDQFIAATPHQFETVEGTEATCTEGGVQQLRCATCGTTETRQIPARGHLWGAWNVQTMPNCTESGRQSRSCTQCGAAETQEIKPTGHKLVNPKESETQKGATEWFCENCGQTIVKKSAAKKIKKPLIILAIVALLIALPVILISTVFKAQYHTFMANTYMSLGKHEKAYYQLKELQSYCVRNCKDNCEEHKETLKQLDKFYVLVGKETKLFESGVEYFLEEKYDEDEHKIILQSYNASGMKDVDSERYFDEDGNLILYVYGYGISGEEVTKYRDTYDKDGNRITRTWYVDGKLDSKTEYTYDKDGNQISATHYDASGKQEYKYKYTYDKYGNIKTEKKYDSTGKLQSTTEHTYNKKGKLTSRREYDDSGELVYQEKVTYDIKGNKTIEYYGSNGQLSYKYEYKNGNITSKTYYSRGEVRDYVKFTYDKYGNQISCVVYENGNRELIIEREDFEVIYLVQD